MKTLTFNEPQVKAIGFCIMYFLSNCLHGRLNDEYLDRISEVMEMIDNFLEKENA